MLRNYACCVFDFVCFASFVCVSVCDEVQRFLDTPLERNLQLLDERGHSLLIELPSVFVQPQVEMIVSRQRGDERGVLLRHARVAACNQHVTGGGVVESWGAGASIWPSRARRGWAWALRS